MRKFIHSHLFYDLLLIIGISIIAGILLLINNNKKVDQMYAKIYFENELIEVIDLTKASENIIKDIKLNDELTIKVEYKYNAIRTIEAPCHTKECIKMNWTSSVNKPIICMDLHYKIVIERTVDNPDVVI